MPIQVRNRTEPGRRKRKVAAERSEADFLVGLPQTLVRQLAVPKIALVQVLTILQSDPVLGGTPAASTAELIRLRSQPVAAFISAWTERRLEPRLL